MKVDTMVEELSPEQFTFRFIHTQINLMLPKEGPGDTMSGENNATIAITFLEIHQSSALTMYYSVNVAQTLNIPTAQAKRLHNHVHEQILLVTERTPLHLKNYNSFLQFLSVVELISNTVYQRYS